MREPGSDGAAAGFRLAAGLASLGRLLRRLVQAFGLCLGALALAFAASAFLYNRLLDYRAAFVGWPPPSEFMAPVAWEPDKPDLMRILAIDGGGVDGIVTLEILKYFEERSGKPIAEMFDLVSGTSTGAIIAVGLLLDDDHGNPRYSADDLIHLYLGFARRILDAPLYHKVLTLNGVLGPRLLNNARIIASHQMFADLRFGDLRRPALIPVFSRARGGLYTFRNWTADGANVFLGSLVAAATSAPTYFPAVRLIGHDGLAGIFADAGLIMDNAAQFAFLLALEKNPRGNFVVVSVGTEQVNTISVEGAVSGGVLGWVDPMLAMIANGQKNLSTRTLEVLESVDMPYRLEAFRLAPEIPWTGTQFDGSPANIERLHELAQNYVDSQREELDRILEVLLDPRHEVGEPDS